MDSTLLMFIGLWFAAVIFFIVLEIMTTALVSIWFIPGALAGMICAALGGGFMLQIIIFLVVSILSIIFLKPFAKKFATPKEKTNIDALIDAKAIVTEEIDNTHDKGQVKINGQLWGAVSESGEIIPQGKIVIIREIHGIKLTVKGDK